MDEYYEEYLTTLKPKEMGTNSGFEYWLCEKIESYGKRIDKSAVELTQSQEQIESAEAVLREALGMRNHSLK